MWLLRATRTGGLLRVSEHPIVFTVNPKPLQHLNASHCDELCILMQACLPSYFPAMTHFCNLEKWFYHIRSTDKAGVLPFSVLMSCLQPKVLKLIPTWFCCGVKIVIMEFWGNFMYLLDSNSFINIFLPVIKTGVWNFCLCFWQWE